MYLFELHRQVDAIQIGPHNICLYKEVEKKYTGCNPKTTELFDCVSNNEQGYEIVEDNKTKTEARD